MDLGVPSLAASLPSPSSNPPRAVMPADTAAPRRGGRRRRSTTGGEQWSPSWGMLREECHPPDIRSRTTHRGYHASMTTITRKGHPGWVPHRYQDGTYCVHSQITTDPINHDSNAQHLATLDSVVEKLRTGKYKLRMSSSPSANEMSLISPRSILIDGIPVGG